MADYDNPRPTSQPIGSTDLAVAKDNLITYDNIVNSTDLEVTNRKGATKRTLAGMEAYANSQILAAISAVGYTVVGSFEDGTTATQLGDAVYYAGDPLDSYANEGFYAWNGAFPKTITAGTSPLDESGWQLAATGYTKQSGTIQLFGQLIDADISIPSGQNALSINPTVSDGVTVTVPSGSEYVILGSAV